MKKLYLLLIILPAIAIFFSGCDLLDDPADDGPLGTIAMGNTFTFIARSDDADDGDTVYGILVDAADPDACEGEILYQGSAQISGGSAIINVNNVDDGYYRGCSFIDLDGNASASSPWADSGDLYIYSTGNSTRPHITIPDEIQRIVEDDEWDTM